MLCCNVASRASSKFFSHGCYNVASRASRKLIEMDVGTSGPQFLELLEMDVMLLRNIQSVFEVASNGCYNV